MKSAAQLLLLIITTMFFALAEVLALATRGSELISSKSFGRIA